MSSIYNALTIDVEDYYMVSAFADIVKFEDWPKYDSRVEINTRKILELLSEYNVKATFFVLGWVAEQNPELVREIHSEGHEVASHGYNHKLLYNLTPDEFREDVRKTKSILEDIIGKPAIGFRAASFSMVKDTLGSLDILMEEGFLYDSSIFPVYHDRYGCPGTERFPHNIKRESGNIYEFPLSTYCIFGQNIPVAGGGYFRLFPLSITKAAIKRINEQENNPVIFYIHPWEIDAGQPKINGSWLSQVRHYININTTMSKLTALLKEFKFKPLTKFLDNI